jgi:hypothetical protein
VRSTRGFAIRRNLRVLEMMEGPREVEWEHGGRDGRAKQEEGTPDEEEICFRGEDMAREGIDSPSNAHFSSGKDRAVRMFLSKHRADQANPDGRANRPGEPPDSVLVLEL